MSVRLHAAVRREIRRLEVLLAIADSPSDIELLRCAIADLITLSSNVRKRLDEQWKVAQ